MASRRWTDEEVAALREMREQGVSLNDIAARLGRSYCSVDHKIYKLGPHDTAAPTALESAGRRVPQLDEHVLDMRAEIDRLNAKIAELTGQRRWETRSASQQIVGCTLTLRRSDDHHADLGHMLSCSKNLTQKAQQVVQEYQPSRIQLVMGDDWIAGRGIYKEQDLDCAVSAIEKQVAVGVWKAREFLLAIREVSAAPISILWMRGNHEHVNKTDVSQALFFQNKVVCEDVPDVLWSYGADRQVVNLAHTGTHNVLVMHGYGHSSSTPNSPRFISDVKDAILLWQRSHQPHEQIRRVLSGHTHWLSVGLERITGLFFDTTGGLQRNTRVQLGMNNRPSGWIVYVSPPDKEGELLRPLDLTPEESVYLREVNDPLLQHANRKDCAECLEAYEELLRKRGLLPQKCDTLLTEGRW